MRFILLTFLLGLFGGVELAQAVPLKVLFQDVKLPTQRVLERQVFAIPLASSSNYIVQDTAGNTSAAAATLTTFTHQPDVARNLEITPLPATNLAACQVVVKGTDINGHAIYEGFVFNSASTAKVKGLAAFKTVTEVDWPASCENSTYNVKWSIGIGEALGVKRCLDNTGDIGWSVYNGTKEATAPTMVVNASVVSLNTADFVGTMDGAKNFILYYVQNYKCF